MRPHVANIPPESLWELFVDEASASPDCGGAPRPMGPTQRAITEHFFVQMLRDQLERVALKGRRA